MTAFVSSKQETGRLYTMVATTDAIAHMIASPLLQWVWGRALTLGGRWIVLPFLVLMVSLKPDLRFARLTNAVHLPISFWILLFLTGARSM